MREDLGKWGNIGSSLGGAIGGGLSALAEEKARGHGVAQRRESNVNALRSVGFSEEEASQLSTLPQQDIGRLLLGKQKEESTRARYAGSAATISQVGGGEGASQEELAAKLATMPPNEQLQYMKLLEDRKNKAGDVEFRERSLDEKIKEAEKSRAQKAELAEKKMESAALLPETKAIVTRMTDIERKATSARDSEPHLKSIIALADDDDLQSGTVRRLLKRVGFEGFGQSPSTDYTSNLIGNLNLITMMGNGVRGKASASLLEQLGLTNPSLLMTNDGMKATARLRLLDGEMANLEHNAVRKVRAKYKGAVPRDFFDQVDELVAKERAVLQNQAIQIAESFLKKSGAITEVTEYEIGSPAIDPSTGKVLSDGAVLEDPDTGEGVRVSKSGKWAAL